MAIVFIKNNSSSNKKHGHLGGLSSQGLRLFGSWPPPRRSAAESLVASAEPLEEPLYPLQHGKSMTNKYTYMNDMQ